MAAINVGPAATNRAAYTVGGYTLLDLANPADGTGTITQIQVYVYTATMTAVKAGMFYLVSGTTYKCRSSASLGDLVAGLNTKAVSMAVVSGDVIGLYWASAGENLDRDDSGGSSASYAGECIDVDDQAVFTTGARIYSFHGTGSTLVPVTAFSSVAVEMLVGR